MQLVQDNEYLAHKKLELAVIIISAHNGRFVSIHLNQQHVVLHAYSSSID